MQVGKMKQTLFSALCSLLLVGACIEVPYTFQATGGQADLWSRRQTISELIDSPSTDLRTRIVLAEVERILTYADAQGLSDQGNYRDFVDIERDAVVWFMTASKPLEFEEKVWGFPVVGSFPYLGWFRFQDALTYREKLESEGWDVYLRRVRAYSTGGWFRDPVLSTMISRTDEALLWLATVIFHELTHANILISDQSTFNESIASFVGDTMADRFLRERFGESSKEFLRFQEVLAEERRAGARLKKSYQELAALYSSGKSDKDKLKEKKSALDSLRVELDLPYAPNNASLIGFRTYNAGQKDIEELFVACGRRWADFFKAIEDIDTEWFAEEQMEDISAVTGRAKKSCP